MIYLEKKQDHDFSGDLQPDIIEGDEFEDISDDLTDSMTLGKKRKILLSDIDKSGNIDHYKKDLKQDIEALESLMNNLDKFEKSIKIEAAGHKTYISKDEKIQSLIKEIIEKRASGNNNDNQKVIIFTVYKDTAFYLFDQLKQRGFTQMAVVSGDVSKTDSSMQETKLFEPILERFAPFTKLFNEKEWQYTNIEKKLSKYDQYRLWREWAAENDKKLYDKIKNPIDILIATDVLSEGQNLQDCDMVINYDIHWNPVRIIQRFGRIDRLGSPNKKIFGVNYWPSDNINNYLNLKGRIEERMTMMKLAGSEVYLEFSDRFKEMASDDDFEDKLNKKMLIQMQTSWDEIEVNDAGLGFDNLSLQDFRQDLLEELQRDEKYYKNMPKAV